MTSYHLTDVLPAGHLPFGFDTVRRIVDRAGTVQVDDHGITLRGVLPRRVAWGSIRSIEIASRLDSLIDIGLGLVPVMRIPGLQPVTERIIDRTAETLAPDVYRRLREATGWRLVRLQLAVDDDVEVRRLPSLVLQLYPSATRDIEARAAVRNIPVERVRLLR